MKVKLVSNNVDLLEPLRGLGYFEEVTLSDILEEALEADILIISSILIGHNMLSDMYGRYAQQLKSKKLFYMLTDNEGDSPNDLIAHICEARDITVIPPKMTINQIIEHLTHTLFPDMGRKNSKVVAFFGAAGDVGTSMVSQSVAEILAQNTEYKIGLYILNDSMGPYYVKLREDEDISIDEIKAELWSNVLSPEKLLQTCVQRNNLYILQAPRYLPDMRHFHPEHVEQLLELGSNVFDIIIIDAGASYNLGLTIGVLRSATHKYLVTTQQEKPRLKFEQVQSQIFKSLQLKTTDFMIIINKFLKDTSMYDGKQMADLYKMTLAATPPHLEFMGWQAEVDRKTLLHFNSIDFIEQIELTARLIAKQLKVEYRDQELKKPGFIKQLFGRGQAG
ncbi:hypothetical protein [Paenibacillus sp. FSL H7-0331]|uniref:AAA family ATPase n=1 Tax=Paenibacillus sp. FSL H7-0331 TaxID=1920421 RepID=UPI00096DBCC4|nr:hypothetical protein [Paenibacillus sp. FSL H7-0331]OME97309.1 hypothetical protein BK127_40970 [Paenibacillus sp. FSL H7-0331]